MKFHERFEIPIDYEQAKKRFVHRAYNLIFSEFYLILIGFYRGYNQILRAIAYKLGDSHTKNDIEKYVGEDFLLCLQTIEALYEFVNDGFKMDLHNLVLRILQDSELDLGVRWENGQFIKSGAKLLDDELVNKPLHWLKEKHYESVLLPYSKGLEHFLQSEKRPQLLSDVITDMYESLEALAKIVTGRETKDLSANAELFLKAVGASEAYKKILKEYIAYANIYRHAVADSAQKPTLTHAEVESFMYMTGVFIRLVIQKG